MEGDSKASTHEPWQSEHVSLKLSTEVKAELNDGRFDLEGENSVGYIKGMSAMERRNRI